MDPTFLSLLYISLPRNLHKKTCARVAQLDNAYDSYWKSRKDETFLVTFKSYREIVGSTPVSNPPSLSFQLSSVLPFYQTSGEANASFFCTGAERTRAGLRVVFCTGTSGTNPGRSQSIVQFDAKAAKVGTLSPLLQSFFAFRNFTTRNVSHAPSYDMKDRASSIHTFSYARTHDKT